MSEIFGFDELYKILSEAENKIDNKSTELLVNTATECVAETQSRTPVKSGGLKRSWTKTDVQGTGIDKSIETGSNIEYAVDVEDGHATKNGGFVKGHYMLKDSFTLVSKKFEKECDELLKDAFGELVL